jgi:hypothetical protein
VTYSHDGTQCELKEDEDLLSSAADLEGGDSEATARAMKDTKMLEVIFRTVLADTNELARALVRSSYTVDLSLGNRETRPVNTK